MKFRPCIDLHEGKVKQIVGSTLREQSPASLQTNFVADQPPAYYAGLYKKDGLDGGHVIMLGPGNEDAAIEALGAFSGGLQIGGGINDENAPFWLRKGASHVIVTSWVFRDGMVDVARLHRLVEVIGKSRLVLDLSCRKKDSDYYIVTDRWQNFTEVKIDASTLSELSEYCDEFLVHAADVEGKCEGVEVELVKILGASSPIPTTYAGGIRGITDLELVHKFGQGQLDFTIGSALDLFGGTHIRYADAVSFHNRHAQSHA
ncbi:MAG: phosphoribosylformimino-5-aminoimidazole carboxamide ribotide isomerase [Desulfobulbaceae bacterium]|nr:MAG: phosphoribosylformimino-5-aminoimidazole carboxamide ribotide isomerase [Desulfobulbaceae bacterium]